MVNEFKRPGGPGTLPVVVAATVTALALLAGGVGGVLLSGVLKRGADGEPPAIPPLVVEDRHFGLPRIREMDAKAERVWDSASAVLTDKELRSEDIARTGARLEATIEAIQDSLDTMRAIEEALAKLAADAGHGGPGAPSAAAPPGEVQ